MNYYVIIDGNQHGPLSVEQLRGLSVKPETPVWHEGLTDWTTIAKIPALMSALFPAVPPQNPCQIAPPQRPVVPPQQNFNYGEQSGINASTWKANGIILTVLGVIFSFLAMIFGIIAIVSAAKVPKLEAEGNYQRAREKASTARTMCILGYCVLALGVVFNIAVLGEIFQDF